MRYIGVDLHRRLLVACVIEVRDGVRTVVERARWTNRQTEEMLSFLERQRPFQIVMEATATYDWFAELCEPLAERIVLAHPRKLRVIAESTRKTDKLDAQTLAEFLALDMIPESHRPSPRLREHRTLVRQRCFLKRRTTSVKNKLRWMLARYNAEQPSLVSKAGRDYLATVALSPGDRFTVDQLLADLTHDERQIRALDRRLGAQNAAWLAEQLGGKVVVPSDRDWMWENYREFRQVFKLARDAGLVLFY